MVFCAEAMTPLPIHPVRSRGTRICQRILFLVPADSAGTVCQPPSLFPGYRLYAMYRLCARFRSLGLQCERTLEHVVVLSTCNHEIPAR